MLTSLRPLPYLASFCMYSYMVVVTAACGSDGPDKPAKSSASSAPSKLEDENGQIDEDYAEIGVSYRAEGRGLNLVADSLKSYTAKVEGGPRCFGDLYNDGAKDDVSINVASGERIRIRRGASNCNITVTSMVFTSNAAVSSPTGITYQTKATANFKKSDNSTLFVTVAKGVDDTTAAISGNIEVRLVGSYIDKDKATVKNSELFVAVSAEAYVAPHIKIDGDVTLFNNRLYAKITCLAQELKGQDGCKDTMNQDQPLKQMDVWVTGEDLEKIAIADRFAQINAKFKKNGSIERVSNVQDFSGFQLMTQGKLGIVPEPSFSTKAAAYLVVRFTDNQAPAYKVFSLSISN